MNIKCEGENYGNSVQNNHIKRYCLHEYLSFSSPSPDVRIACTSLTLPAIQSSIMTIYLPPTLQLCYHIKSLKVLNILKTIRYFHLK